MKIIGFGTFDGVHLGHLYFLRELKKLGNELIIVIARDENVLKTKGKSTKFNENVRLNHIKKGNIADKVVLGSYNDIYECLREQKPDIIGLGYDQNADLSYLEENFPGIEIVRIGAYEPDKYKSSIINK